ncbi:MAG: putative quinol monooxygenase [Rhizobiaceae bacterium]
MKYGDFPIGTYCLKGHIDVPTGRLAKLKEALTEHINLTRSEAGCLSFDVEPCAEVEGRFLVSEAFLDEAAFIAHQERTANSVWAEVSAGIPRIYETWAVP